MIQTTRGLTHQTGVSYVETMIAVVFMVLVLLPLMQSLQWGVQTTQFNQEQVTQHYHLTSKLEAVLSESYKSQLDAAATAGSHTIATSFSDASGEENRRLVYISFYDVDNDDGDGDLFSILDANTDLDNNPYTGADVDIDLLWIKVEIENTGLVIETLVVKP